jgi:hypothetical protein
MEIKPTYITFEQAKLLKEKGFDLKVYNVYFPINEPDKSLYEFTQNDWGHLQYSELPYHFPYEHFTHLPAPEQWQLVEWLRVEKGIWIVVSHNKDHSAWFFMITKCGEGKPMWESIVNDKDTPQEAYSAAFDYVLTTLI